MSVTSSEFIGFVLASLATYHLGGRLWREGREGILLLCNLAFLATFAHGEWSRLLPIAA
jgi:hypothetical protein